MHDEHHATEDSASEAQRLEEEKAYEAQLREEEEAEEVERGDIDAITRLLPRLDGTGNRWPPVSNLLTTFDEAIRDAASRRGWGQPFVTVMLWTLFKSWLKEGTTGRRPPAPDEVDDGHEFLVMVTLALDALKRSPSPDLEATLKMGLAATALRAAGYGAERRTRPGDD